MKLLKISPVEILFTLYLPTRIKQFNNNQIFSVFDKLLLNKKRYLFDGMTVAISYKDKTFEQSFVHHWVDVLLETGHIESFWHALRCARWFSQEDSFQEMLDGLEIDCPHESSKIIANLLKRARFYDKNS